MLEQELAKNAEDLQIIGNLKKEFDTLLALKKQVDADNGILRKTITDMLEQPRKTEQRVTDRFANELKTKVEQLQMQTVKTTSLSTLVTTLKDSESTVKKELEKLESENDLMSVKYSNQAAEHAATFTVCFILSRGRRQSSQGFRQMANVLLRA